MGTGVLLDDMKGTRHHAPAAALVNPQKSGRLIYWKHLSFFGFKSDRIRERARRQLPGLGTIMQG